MHLSRGYEGQQSLLQVCSDVGAALPGPQLQPSHRFRAAGVEAPVFLRTAPFDRDKSERARNKFIEVQALIEALDRGIAGEQVAS